MADPGPLIPPPEPGDPDEVATALETANALWGIGQKQEALRLLRRAAEEAEAAGNDLRSVKLARAAADVASSLQAEARPQSLTPPPPAVSTTPAARVAPSPPASTKASTSPVVATPSRSITPQPAPRVLSQTKAQSIPPAAPAAAQPRPRTVPPAAQAPAAAQPKAKTVPPAAQAPAAAQPKAKTVPPAAPAPEEAKARAVLPTTPVQATKPARTTPPAEGSTAGAAAMPLVSVKSKTPSNAPPAQPSSTDEWQAVRVSIKVSARDPSLFVVRRLENGKPPPAGTRQALLVLLDPATDLGAVVSDEK